MNLLAFIATALVSALIALASVRIYWHRRIVALNRATVLIAEVWYALDPASRPPLTFRHRLALGLAASADTLRLHLRPDWRDS